MCLAINKYAFFTPYMKSRLFRPIFVLASIVAVSACSGDVTREYRVDTGIHPEEQDENVRFRTTYYFRVFDVCTADEFGKSFGDNDPGDPSASAKAQATKMTTKLEAMTTVQKERQKAQYGDDIFSKKRLGRYEIRNDSLYRFRMTGKASALFKDVHFEAGTLRAEQIDPFGTKIRYDSKGRSFSVSPGEDRRTRQREASFEAIEKLAATRANLAKAGLTQDQIKVLDSKMVEAITNQIPPPTEGGVICPTGQDGRRGFQILGPEGFRTFDQDERLILAMTSNSKPLIGLLQEITSRMQRSKEESATLLLPLARERSRILDGQRLTATTTLELAKSAAAESSSENFASEDFAPKTFVEVLRSAFNRGVKRGATSPKTDSKSIDSNQTKKTLDSTKPETDREGVEAPAR